MNPRDTLLLDVDGVLLRPETSFRDVLASQYGITAEMTAPFFATRFVQCQLGNADLIGELERVLAGWSWPSTASDFVEEWFATERDLDNELLQVICRLRDEGTQIVLATMQEPHRMNYLLHDLGLKQYCDAVLVTHEIGCRKSDPAFFTAGLDRIRAEPTRTIFFDDQAENVTAARACAIRAFEFIDARQVADEVERMAR